MYATVQDPYCYRGTIILRNRLGLRDQAALDSLEAEMTTQRLAEPLPIGRCSISHYRAVHRHLFGDIYSWAGRFRRVRIAKGNSMFAYPEHIQTEMRRVFRGLHDDGAMRPQPRADFSRKAAHFLAELNAIHPFRDGNGRAQLTFLAIVGHAAGSPLDLGRLDPAEMLNAMIKSFGGDEAPLTACILRLLRS